MRSTTCATPMDGRARRSDAPSRDLAPGELDGGRGAACRAGATAGILTAVVLASSACSPVGGASAPGLDGARPSAAPVPSGPTPPSAAAVPGPTDTTGARMPDQANQYVGLWVTEDGNIRQRLQPDGRYVEARGTDESAYTGRYEITGDHIEYWDDSGFTADGDFRDDVLYHGGMVMRRSDR